MTHTIAPPGYVILNGCKITTAEFANQIGAKCQYYSIDLRGYPHPLPDWIISAGVDVRGYWFAAIRQDGEWRIRAGCRDFSVEEALSHWGPGSKSDRPDCLALVEKIVAEIRNRQTPNPGRR